MQAKIHGLAYASVYVARNGSDEVTTTITL